MGEILITLFSVSYGTVGLVEILWTVGALVAFLVCLVAIWRSQRRSGSLRGIDGYTRRWVNRSILVRNGMLALVLEVTVFVGLWAMFEPPTDALAPNAAVSGFVLWMLELAIITTVLYEESVTHLIRRHLGEER